MYFIYNCISYVSYTKLITYEHMFVVIMHDKYSHILIIFYFIFLFLHYFSCIQFVCRSHLHLCTSFVCIYSATPTNATTATTAKINGQTTPLDVTNLSQSDIQGLLLSSHPSAAAVAAQALSVKREPEDLRKEPKSSRSQKVSVITCCLSCCRNRKL